MKRALWIVLLVLILTGCASEPVYETIGNVWYNTQPVHSPCVIEFALPEDAQMEVLSQSKEHSVYQIGQWMLWTQVLEGGDVMATMQTVTGMGEEKLGIVTHPQGRYSCHETVWAVAEEEGEAVVRTAVIPYDGYHYCLSMKSPAGQAEQAGKFFSGLLDNVNLSDTAP